MLGASKKARPLHCDLPLLVGRQTVLGRVGMSSQLAASPPVLQINLRPAAPPAVLQINLRPAIQGITLPGSEKEQPWSSLVTRGVPLPSCPLLPVRILPYLVTAQWSPPMPPPRPLPDPSPTPLPAPAAPRHRALPRSLEEHASVASCRVRGGHRRWDGVGAWEGQICLRTISLPSRRGGMLHDNRTNISRCIRPQRLGRAKAETACAHIVEVWDRDRSNACPGLTHAVFFFPCFHYGTWTMDKAAPAPCRIRLRHKR